MVSIAPTHQTVTGKMGKLSRAKISAIDIAVPPNLLTNADLEKLVATTDQWIMDRTGIRQRHIVEKGVTSSDLGAEAAQKILDKTGVPASEIDFDYLFNYQSRYVFASYCLSGAKQNWRHQSLGL